VLPFGFDVGELPDRLRSRLTVDPVDGCWLASGPYDRDGYARIGDRNLHREVWIALNGPVPAGLVLDHWRLDEELRCSRACCRPEHLNPVPNLVNLSKSPRSNASKIACDHGHEFNHANTYRHNGRRSCRRCNADAVNRYKQRRRARAMAGRQPEHLNRAA
jgi:hypothetical protein